MNALFALLLAVLANMVIGFLWYGPLFGKHWMKALGWTNKDLEKQKQGMWKVWVLVVMGETMTALVLHKLIESFPLTESSLLASTLLAVLLWLGFVFPILSLTVLFENRSKTVFWIGAAYQLVALIVMAAILTLADGALF
jgi:hypothetical protein